MSSERSTPLASHLRSLASFVRLRRFAASGFSGFLADMATLALLVEIAGLPPLVGKVASAETAILLMFLINERWTFKTFGQADLRSTVRRLGNSHAVRILGVGLAAGTLAVLHHGLGVNYLLANAAGIGVGFVSNYVLESLTTWRVGG